MMQFSVLAKYKENFVNNFLIKNPRFFTKFDNSMKYNKKALPKMGKAFILDCFNLEFIS